MSAPESIASPAAVGSPHPPVSPPPARRGTWLAIGLGIAIALATTGRLVTATHEAIPGPTECRAITCADEPLCLWIMATAGRRLYTNPAALFDATVFHPLRHTLAYSESMLSAAVFMGPLEWITGSPIAAYDWLYLATIVLGVVGMFLLVREMTGDPRAALVAGALFGLTSERMTWWGFPPALAVHWAPFLLWTWIRFLDRPSGRRGLALGAVLVAHMHSGVYHGLMLPALLVPWALVLALGGPWPLRRWVWSALPLAVAGALALALYLPYVVVREELGYQPGSIAIALGYQYWHPLLHPIEYVVSRLGEPFGFPTASPLALWLAALAGAVAIARRRRTPGPPGIPAHAAGAIVLLGFAMAVSMGAILWTPFGLLPGPLAALRQLPAFDAMRAVVRFMVLAAFARAILGGLAVAVVLARVPPAAGRALTLVVLLCAAIDARLGDARPLHDVSIPREWREGYAWLARTPPDAGILELPYGLFGTDAHYMVYALSHGRPLMNGYSAITPRFADVMAQLPAPVAMRALAAADVRYILLHPSRTGLPTAAAFMRALAKRGKRPVTTRDDTIVIPVSPDHRPKRRRGPALAPGSWHVEASAPGAALAVDGDLATHWRTSSAETVQYLRVDLGRVSRITGLAIELGAHVLEYPRMYQVRASQDGITWETAGAEIPTVPPFASYRRDHRDVRLDLDMQPTDARWIEVRVPKYPDAPFIFGDGTWAVHELVVFGEDVTAPR